MLVKLDAFKLNDKGDFMAGFEQVFDQHEMEDCFEKYNMLKDDGYNVTWTNLGPIEKGAYFDRVQAELNEALKYMYG